VPDDIVRSIATATLSDAWGLLQRHEFELKRQNGAWQKQIRETYDRGDGAAVLLCDLSDKTVVLIRQFRYPAYYRGETPYVIEVCAGRPVTLAYRPSCPRLRPASAALPAIALSTRRKRE